MRQALGLAALLLFATAALWYLTKGRGASLASCKSEYLISYIGARLSPPSETDPGDHSILSIDALPLPNRILPKGGLTSRDTIPERLNVEVDKGIIVAMYCG